MGLSGLLLVAFLVTRVPIVLARRLWHLLLQFLQQKIPKRFMPRAWRETTQLQHLVLSTSEELKLQMTKFAGAWLTRDDIQARLVHLAEEQVQAAQCEIQKAGGKTAEGIPFEGYWFRSKGTKSYERAREVVLLYFHGGYFKVGCATMHTTAFDDILARVKGIPKRTPLAIFSLEYGLIPEHPYPYALKQAVGAYKWLAAQGNGRIILGGDSAGGNLALATMLALRQDNIHPLGGLLISPRVDSTAIRSPAKSAYDWVNVRWLEESPKQYLGAKYPDMLGHPHISPICGDPTGLPHMAIFVGGCETYSDEILSYAARCLAVGVIVDLHYERGMMHCFPLNTNFGDHKAIGEARQAIAEFLAHPAANHTLSPAPSLTSEISITSQT